MPAIAFLLGVNAGVAPPTLFFVFNLSFVVVSWGRSGGCMMDCPSRLVVVTAEAGLRLRFMARASCLTWLRLILGP